MTARALLVPALSAAGLALLAVGCSCSDERPNTQVMVTIDADPGVRMMSRQLQVYVYGPPADAEGVPITVSFDRAFDVADFGWPITVALAPTDRDPTRRYRVEGIAQTAAGAHVATVRAVSGYVEGQTLWLRLRLIDACIGVTCEDPGQTCIGPDACGDSRIDPGMLPPWTAPDAGMTGMDGGPPPDGGAECVDADCDDGFECTLDFCGPGGVCTSVPRDVMCDDGEVCTDDTCTGEGPDGCGHTPNTLGCNDGVYCNGIDVCAGGECQHPGDPCLGSTTCSETMGGCIGCSATSPCPTGGETFGTCTYADPTCDEVGSQPRTTISYECVATLCVETRVEDTVDCGRRTTEGVSCGATSCGSFGACAGATACALSGTQSRTCMDRACASGTCETATRADSRSCARDTDGDFCNDGNACTDMEMCASGVCSGGIYVCDAGGLDAGRDSGVDAGRDSGLPMTSDGGTWPCQTNASLCDDGTTCTDDSCDPLVAGHDANGCINLLNGSCLPDAAI